MIGEVGKNAVWKVKVETVLASIYSTLDSEALDQKDVKATAILGNLVEKNDRGGYYYGGRFVHPFWPTFG